MVCIYSSISNTRILIETKLAGQMVPIPPDFQGRLPRNPARPTRGKKKRQNQPRPVILASSLPHNNTPAQCIVDYSIPSRPRIRHAASSSGIGDSRLSVRQNDVSAVSPRSTSRNSHVSSHISQFGAPRSWSRLGARDGEGHVVVARSPSRINAAAPVVANNPADPPPPYMPPSPPRAPEPLVTSNSTPQFRDASDNSDTPPSSPASSSDHSLTDPEDTAALMFQIAWEHDREAGYTMDERVTRDLQRRKAAEKGVMPRLKGRGLAASTTTTDIPVERPSNHEPATLLRDSHLDARLPDVPPGSSAVLQAQNSCDQESGVILGREIADASAARHEDDAPVIILSRSMTPPSQIATNMTRTMSSSHLPRPLPTPPPSATRHPTSAYVSIYHASPPTSQNVGPTTSTLTSPESETIDPLPPQHNVGATSPSSDANGPNRTPNSVSLDEQSSHPSNLPAGLASNNSCFIMGHTDNTPQFQQNSALSPTLTPSHPRSPLPLPRRARMRSGSMPVAAPSSFSLDPSSPSRPRPRSPVLGESPSTVMDRLGSFEALTTRRRPPPAPPRRPTMRTRHMSTPVPDPEDQEEYISTSRSAPNVGTRDATAPPLSASRGGSESGNLLDDTVVRVSVDDHSGTTSLPFQSSNPRPRPTSEAPLLAPQPTVGVSEPDLELPEHDYENNGNFSVDIAAETGPRRQQSYEYTDLDLLVARLDRPAATGQSASYEDLLAITDFVGPAVSPSSAANAEAIENLPVAPVQVERRRITRDGRKKLKLSLMGVVVDRCSVCMSQFKQQELGVLLPCHHS